MSSIRSRVRPSLVAAFIATMLLASNAAPAIADAPAGVDSGASQDGDSRETEAQGPPEPAPKVTPPVEDKAQGSPVASDPPPEAKAPGKAQPSEEKPGSDSPVKGAASAEKEPAELLPPGLTSRSAPASGSRLAPGTYTVTANPYVSGADAPVGVNVYLSDPGFPPIRPQKNNATLRVAADGTMDVDIPFTQEIFTLQSLSDGADVAIASTTRGGTIAWGNNDPDPAYPDRITSVTVRLGNASGEYTFGKATEYAVILLAEKHWEIHLNVDLANAQRHASEDFVREYVDPTSGAKARISAGASNPLIGALSGATLRAERPAPDEATLRHALEQEFVSAPRFESWQLSLETEGEPIALGGDIGLTVWLPTANAQPRVMRLDGSTATKLETGPPDGGVVSFSARGLGTFAVVDGESSRRWEFQKEFSRDVGTTMTYRTTGEADWSFPGMDVETLNTLGAYNAYLGEETTHDRLAEARRLLSSYASNLELRMFAFGLDLSFEGVPLATSALHQAWVGRLGGGLTSLSATAPARDPHDRVFLVKGTVGTGLQEVQPVHSNFENGHVRFAIVEKDADLETDASRIQVPLWNAATGKEQVIDTPQTPETEIAYIVVAREALTPIEKPRAAVGLSYTGKSQAGVPAGDGYALSVRPSAKDAGTYVARATLKRGYRWSDGGTKPIDIRWEIAQAPLEVKYAGEKIGANGVPRLEVTTTGFVNGESPETAAAFVHPKVRGPERLTPGGIYRLTPAGGSASNYRFSYLEGTLTVGQNPDSGGWKPGTYRITANLFVPASENDILGRTAFMTNPKNPLAPEGSANYGIPLEPVSDNATLTVAANGARSLTIDLPNPAFTLIEFGTPSKGVTVSGVHRDGKKLGAHTAGRITKVVLALDSTTSTAVFTRSRVFAAPLGVDKTWNLSLEVDTASARRVSDDTQVKVPGSPQKPPVTRPGASQKPPHGTVGRPGDGTPPRPALGLQPTRLKAGNYTVSANIWLSRSVTGLPLDPHITNGGFPPKDPVTNNATLAVDTDGNGTVTVPIAIQSRIMTIRSLSGGGVISTSGGNALTSATIDLGKIDPTVERISRSLDASVTIGDLAYSIGGPIFQGSREHTWPASFEVAIAGVPTSGGGIVPEIVQSKLNGKPSADEAKLLKALEAAKEANASSREADNGAAGQDGSGKTTFERQELSRTGAIVLGTGALLALVLAGFLLLLRRKRRIRAEGVEIGIDA